MSNNRLIEALIFEPRTATDLASVLGIERAEILDVLQDLSVEGMVRPVFNQAAGDVICGACGEEDQGDGAEPGRDCSRRLAEDIWCLGWVVDNCTWVYCGGPVSKALEAA